MRRAVSAVLLAAPFASPLSAQAPRADSATLAPITQRLLDAVTAGDSTTWARYLSSRWAVTDEEGRRITRDEFLRALRPLPAGQSGTLRVADWHDVAVETVVVTSYAADESHDLYGQRLTTRYRQTDTWAREGDGWRLLASQVTALPTPIAGRPVPRRVLEAYAGEYALAPGITLTVAVSDSGLVLLRPSGAAERLHALDERIFIRHGARGFWLFERDSADVVSRLVHWRDNNPVAWRRVAR